MLVVTRRPGEWLQIGDDIQVHIVGVQGNQVRIAIDAPRSVKVLRNELIEDDAREEQS